MIFDKEKNEVVNKLKKLHKLKDRKPYQDLKSEILKKYNVSGRTVERWMASRTPGVRKPRADANKVRVPVKKFAKKKVLELLSQGMDLKEIKKLTGVSDRQLERIRKDFTTKSTKGTEVSDNKSKSAAGEPVEESAFGDKVKEIFRELFQLELIAPDKGLKIKLKNNKSVLIKKQDLEDVCLILANAYNRGTFEDEHKYKMDREQLREKLILHLMERQIHLAMEHSDTKTIDALTRMHDRMSKNVELSADIKVVEKICKELKPDIAFDDIVNLIRKHIDS
jgi:hypothetical protein